MKVQVINGPNLNMLGIREPAIYGTLTMAEMNREIEKKAMENGMEVAFFQSNCEGAIIDAIQDCYGSMDGIILNAGAYTHYSYAIRDAIAGVGIPVIEVHLSDIEKREVFRRVSVIREVCREVCKGKGIQSYFEALDLLSQILNKSYENK